MVALRAVVLRAAGVPVGGVRRARAARSRRATGSRVAFPEADAARRQGRRAHLRRAGRQGRREGASTNGRAGRSRRSSSTSSYAPIATDARAMLRPKTLLGETYVELTRGDPGAPRAAPRARGCADGQVRETVQLDEMLSALDAPTRDAFRRLAAGRSAGRSRARGARCQRRARPRCPTSLGRRRTSCSRSSTATRRRCAGPERDTGAVFEASPPTTARCAALVRSAAAVFGATARRRERPRRDDPRSCRRSWREPRATLRRTERVRAPRRPGRARPAARRRGAAPGADRAARRSRPTCGARRGGSTRSSRCRATACPPAGGRRGPRPAARGGRARALRAQPDPRVARVQPAPDDRRCSQRPGRPRGHHATPTGPATQRPLPARRCRPPGSESVALWPERLPGTAATPTWPRRRTRARAARRR